MKLIVATVIAVALLAVPVGASASESTWGPSSITLPASHPLCIARHWGHRLRVTCVRPAPYFSAPGHLGASLLDRRSEWKR